ncbi:MAG TPA: glycosyltransferase family 2 protein, partial [Beijerinckiaceae bacterium]|nr:glycosyltransferase family 2 protein [Beijerinckiaceae bacterium]
RSTGRHRYVGQLVAHLDALDYPRAKLDIKLVVEADDKETRAALRKLRLSANYEIVVAPPGVPRTKPRALNIALDLARGSLLVVFDAEDQPEPGQLRRAAEIFAMAPPRVACLQGRLAVDNIADSWLAHLFAVEYAVLFDVFNPGLAALGLPILLGGTSNHFRTEALRKVGGWDAWNVTEDADLGLRLARKGYEVEVLAESTYEEAPARLGAWVRQRRRWFKGWIQTFVTHSRKPRRFVREVGLLRGAAAFSLLGGTLLGSLGGFAFALLLLHAILFENLLAPSTPMEVAASTLWCFVGVTGLASALLPALIGARRRGIRLSLRWVFLLPVRYLLLLYAAWGGLYDFIREPFYWAKTEHGLARTSRRRTQTSSADSKPKGVASP